VTLVVQTEVVRLDWETSCWEVLLHEGSWRAVLSRLIGCVSESSFSAGYNVKPRISEHS